MGLDSRIQVGTKLVWNKDLNKGSEAVVKSIEGDSFTVTWDDGIVMSEYSDRDLEENGGDFTVVQ